MPGFIQLFSFLDLRGESGETGFKSRRGRQIPPSFCDYLRRIVEVASRVMTLERLI